MSDIKITLDKNANWDSNDLGIFDASSTLADTIDVDDNGIITQSEIECYQKATANKKSEQQKDYTVIQGDQTPKSLQDLVALIKKATEAYDGMTKDANEILEENASFLSQYSSLSQNLSQADMLKQSKSNSDDMEQLSTDFNTTSGSVGSALKNAKKNGLMNSWIFGLFFTSMSNQVGQKGDSVKQLINQTQTKVEDTQQTLEPKTNQNDSNEKKDKTKTV
jgi:hypothetical protein